VLPDGHVAYPIVGQPPAWWTPRVEAKVDEAGKMGLGYDYATDQFVNVAAVYPSEVFIRPGTALLIHRATSAASTQGVNISKVPSIPTTVLCTAAFAYGPLAKGFDAIATAGHCTNVGDNVSVLAAPSVLVNVGQTSSSTGDAGVGNDWAMIDIFPEWEPYVDSDVAWLSGPCGSVTTSD